MSQDAKLIYTEMGTMHALNKSIDEWYALDADAREWHIAYYLAHSRAEALRAWKNKPPDKRTKGNG